MDRARAVALRRGLAFGLARRALLLAATVAAFGAGVLLLSRPETVAAHPLGNFTINLYSHIQLSEETLALRYVADIAEIPAFQERTAIDTDGNGTVSSGEREAYLDAFAERVRDGLDLTLAGERLALEAATSTLSFPPGRGGLDTQRVVIDYGAPMPDGWRDAAPLAVEFRDENYAERIGWREVVVSSLDGVSIGDSTAPSEDSSRELTSYPDAGLADALNVRSATFSFGPGQGTGTPAIAATDAAVAAPEPARGDDRFTSLISSNDVTVPFVLGAMLIAAGFGALHALGPGHGKTIVAAYLVGERGTARHAMALGLTVTATHTVSVFALGLITLYASQFIVPERLYPWLTLVSGLIVVGLGGALLISRLRGLWSRRARRADGVARSPRTEVRGIPALRAGLRPAPAPARSLDDARGHDRNHGHEHGHDHGHSHDVPGADGSPVTWKSLLALGVSGGILPCPSALVVLLGAISLHRVGLGLLLVVAFSIGLAAVLTGIGLAMVWAGRAMSRSRLLGEASPLRRLAFAPLLIGALPAVSALAITAVGAVMTARAVMGDSSSGFGLL